MDTRLLKDLISVEESFTAIIDFKKKVVTTLYDNDKIIGTNLSYSEYAEMACEAKGFTDQTSGKLTRFLTNFNSTDEKFSIQMTCQYKNLVNAVYIATGIRLGEDNYVLSIKKDQRNINTTIDDLTKVYTYNVLVEKAKKAIEAKKNLLLMLINIDNFKLINENYGFLFGDLILIEAGASIKKSLKSDGIVGRMAGDQFIAFLEVEDTDYDSIRQNCIIIKNGITNVSKNNVIQAKITATIGSVTIPLDADNFDDALIKANKALTRGKMKGGNCFIIYSDKCEDPIYNTPIKPNEAAVATSITNEGKIVTGIFEILNHGGDLKRNIYDCFNLIGTFFRLDRIAIFFNETSYNDNDMNVSIEWINPTHPELNGVLNDVFSKYEVKKLRDEYEKYINSLGIFKIDQVESNKHLGFIYENLKETKTSATIIHKLSYMGFQCGVIRYDNTQKNRFWNINETSPLLIISKIFALTIYKEIEKKNLEGLVVYDKLTHLYNYTKWRDTVEDFIATIDAYPNYAIVSFNVLGFTRIVAKNGTSVGDNVIKSVANAIRDNCYEGNIYCRINSDKFLLFIANKSSDEIVEVVRKIQESVQSQYKNITITVLAGICVHKNIETVNNCVDNANAALKNTNANKEIVFFNDEINKEEQYRAEIELHMKDALENNEFLLYLQPKVNTSTGEVVGAEALTRWNYNFSKIIFPNDFIPIFEETGFITELDFNVFENVCAFLRKIIDEGYKPIKISVNVSRYQKDFNNYLTRLNIIREKYNIDAKYLEIEITESMYNDNVDAIAKFIDDLHSYGYFVSMDDFGSGYSNLACLAKLDFDIIKLDKTFCSDITNIKKQKILAFTMKLAKNLDTDVLCEGVETKELIDILKDLGCNIVQGYYYSKPIPKEEFIEKFIEK